MKTRREVAVEKRVRMLGEILAAHAGGLEVTGLEDDSELFLRFTGMCTGCPLRAVTFSGLVKPTLLALDGIDSVSAEGVRLSPEAEARLARQVGSRGSARIRAALEREAEREA